MKDLFSTKTILALAVAIAAATGSISQAQDQPMPPPASLPPEITPDTPLAQVVKLAQAGVDISVISNYVANSTSAFNLDADKIITLTDLGVPKDVVNLMLDRDKAFYVAAATPPPAAVPPATTDAPTDTAPPTAPVTEEYFNETLNPYGSWIIVEGYGRCWRPTAVRYDAGWRPYCDRGHWVYTDCGWYWDSDYTWGSTFHYGRWFRHDRFGWCWSPDTQWGPSWVTWRSSGDYCGWAPLPPLAVYRPGAGFFFRGVSVSVSFDFGLRPDCFTFVTPDRFCEQHPRRFCVEPARVPVVFNHTTVVNNFNSRDNNRFVVNKGIPVTQVRTHDNHPIQSVQIASLPNARRQGWRGDDDNRPGHQGAAGNNNNNQGHNPANGSGQFNHVSAAQSDPHNGNNGNNANNGFNHRQDSGSAGQSHAVNQQVGSPVIVPRPPNTGNQGNQGNQNGKRDRTPNNSDQSTPVAGQSHGGNNGSLIIHGNGGGNSAPSGVVISHPQPVAPLSPIVPAIKPVNPPPAAIDIHNPPLNNSRPAREQKQQQFQQPEQHQYVAPSQPVQQREQRTENVQRSAPPAATPAQSQQSGGSSDRNSDNGSGRNNRKDR